MKIDVRATLGERCMTYEQGERLHDLIHDPLRDGETVEVDFAGVRIFASPFFNAGIGRLYADIPADAVTARLRLSNLNAVGEQTVRLVVDNSKEYFKKDEARRRELDRIVAEAPEREAGGTPGRGNES